MKLYSINYVQALIALMLCSIIGCSQKENKSRVPTLPFYDEATFSPNWLEANSEALANFHQIPPFHLTNQDGQTITEKDFDDKIYVTNFFFTICPGICPEMMTNMAILQNEYLDDPDVLLLSHSVTPETDSVSILHRYAELKGIDSKTWHLVTGERDHIYNLGRKQYFVEEDQGLERTESAFLHTENFVLIDKNRHIRGIYNGLRKTAVKQLIADIETLKGE